ncbi:MAG TPA: acyl-CoA dehydrogenase [Candidatus Marinimicrobia bacterium]|jgi:citronellyl-CoA dehydrogenase|nr:acyl-CoA dehydrogenase [Candidatus Neomarinimicrobiota bacterium]
MKFNNEHKALATTVSKFIDNEINPNVDKWENDGIFPAHELFKKMAALNLLGITKPEKYGGMGLDFSYALVFAEELGRIKCGGIPMAIGVHTEMATPALARFGSDELCREFLAPSIAGDLVSCIGVSEPHAGSDVAAITSSAIKKGSDYIINGSKMWITNSFQGDWVCTLVNTSDKLPHQNKSLIIVPLDTKGITVSKKLDKLGMRSSDTAQIFFEDVRVPQRYCIGEEGKGFQYQMMQFQDERLFGAASIIKTLEWVIEDTIDYTRQRSAFGKKILDFQTIQFRFAELQTEVEALRALIYRASEIFVDNKDVTKLASMAKLKAGRLCREVTDACLQYWGGMGYMWENPVARAFRDMRLLSIGAGTDEVMLNIICKKMNILSK